MSTEARATYLQDHLAGSVAALELLAHLRASDAARSIVPALTQLQADIQADQQALETLMTRLQIAPSRPRQALAWLGGRLSELRLRQGAGDDPALPLLEGLETLALGIAGKQALWQALATVADQTPALQELDYSRLIERARTQRQRIETLRRQAARTALGDAPA